MRSEEHVGRFARDDGALLCEGKTGSGIVRVDRKRDMVCRSDRWIVDYIVSRAIKNR